MEETSFFLLIQYELDLLNLIFNTSFPNNLNTNPNGVIRKKNITIIIIGAINFPEIAAIRDALEIKLQRLEYPEIE